MEELYKIIGAKFLTDAKFQCQVQTPLDIFHSEINLPKEIILEKLHRDMSFSIGNEIFKKFQKEIKIKEVGGFIEQHNLEFFAFSSNTFKLMIEYIISEMPEEEINRLRNKIKI